MVAAVDPFAPIAAVSGAKIASSLTSHPSGRKMAMVLRPCEMRAVVELAKLKQVNLDDVLLIGMDCFGRYENTDFTKFQDQGGTSETFLENAQSGKTSMPDFDIIGACKICEFPTANNVDLRLGAIGAGNGSVFIEAVTGKGEEALEKSGLKPGEAPAGRDDAVKKLVAVRTEARDKKFSEFRADTNSFEALRDKLARLEVPHLGCIGHGAEELRHLVEPVVEQFSGGGNGHGRHRCALAGKLAGNSGQAL